jgi:hypothetical protein
VPYEPNEIGGAQRRLRLYHQDAVNSKTKRGRAAQGDAAGEATCTKYQNATKTLSPGLMVRPLGRQALADGVCFDDFSVHAFSPLEHAWACALACFDLCRRATGAWILCSQSAAA